MFAEFSASAEMLKTVVNFILVPCNAAVYIRLLEDIGRGIRYAEPRFMYLDFLTAVLRGRLDLNPARE